MKRSWNVAFLLLVSTWLGASGCGEKPGEWVPEAAQYATYATQIPLYPGTTIDDAMGSESWGDEAGSHTFGMTFWCLADATKDELVRWYAAALPGATREELEEGGVSFTLAPRGGGEGEDVGVRVDENGKYRVFEHTKKQKPGT